MTKQVSTDERERLRRRCEEQGHEWENCCTAGFTIYERCRWCGERKAPRVLGLEYR